jgi:hypothetical protein
MECQLEKMEGMDLDACSEELEPDDEAAVETC